MDLSFAARAIHSRDSFQLKVGTTYSEVSRDNRYTHDLDTLPSNEKGATAHTARHLQSKVSSRYTPLDETIGEIWLMTLLPGSFESPLYTHLTTTVLTEDDVSQYEALSYVWDSMDMSADVLATIPRDKSQVLHLPITSNLAGALRHLRYECAERRLWIDAICDVRERGRQVARIPDIYGLASKVIVWLGPESHNSGLAMRLLDGFGAKFSVDWATGDILDAAGAHLDLEHKPIDKHSAYYMPYWISMQDLFSRPWFSRLWTLQEMGLAQGTIEVLCGHMKASPHILRNATYCLQKTKRPELPNLSYSLHQAASSSFTHHLPPDLRGLMHVTRHYQCSDPRDRIYALLSLVPDDLKLDIFPDYSISVQEVFRWYTLKDISRFQEMNILFGCSLQNKDPSLPSWVPNWSAESDIEYPGPCVAALDSRGHFYLEDDDTLVVAGIWIAVIDNVKRRADVENSTHGISLGYVRELIKDVISIRQGASIDDTINAIRRTIHMDYFADRYMPPWSHLPFYEEVRHYFTS